MTSCSGGKRSIQLSYGRVTSRAAWPQHSRSAARAREGRPAGWASILSTDRSSGKFPFPRRLTEWKKDRGRLPARNAFIGTERRE